MGLIGGMMSSGLAQGAADVGQIAQGQIDVNNKNQLAQFQSQLDTDRATAAARLAQTIGNENTVNAATGPVGEATRAGTAANTIAAAQTDVNPAVVAAKKSDANIKPEKLNPGEQLVDGDGKVLGQNQRLTMAEMYQNGYRVSPGGNGATKAANFTAAEQDKGLQNTLGNLRKDYADPVTGKPPTVVGNVGAESYQDALGAGQTPGQAEQRAYSDVGRLQDAAKAAMKASPDQYKGMSEGDVMGQMYTQAKAAQRASQAGGSSTSAAPSAPSASKGILASAGAPTPAPGRNSGQQNMDAAAKSAGYTYTKGNDGKDYYVKKDADGHYEAGDILTADQLADKLNLVH